MELAKLTIDRSGNRPASGGRRRRSPWPGRLIALALLLGAGWLFRAPILSWYDGITLPQVNVVRATAITARQSTALSGTSANGYLVAATRAALSADTPGRVVELNVTEGSVVKKGDVVARLYSEEFEAAVERAEADVQLANRGVERAEADANATSADVARFEADLAAARARTDAARTDLALADRELARQQELLDTKVGNARDVDLAESEVARSRANVATNEALIASAQAAVAQANSRLDSAAVAITEASARVPVAEATLSQARATLSKTEVRAPFDGVVVLKDAEVGEVVSPNSQGGSSRGSVVTMVDFASLEVQIDLPETSLAKVSVGQSATVFVDAYASEPFAGTVSRIWPTASRQKATIEVRVRFDAVDDRLKPDMGARVVFQDPAQSQDNAGDAPQVGTLWLPTSAFLGSGDMRRVFVLEGQQVFEREVTVEDGPTGRLRVLSGLEDGDMVVKQPTGALTDGARVRVPAD